LSKFLVCLAAWAAVVGLAQPARAQDSGERIVREVRVRGFERVGEQQIRAQIEIKPGQIYSPRAVARDIRRLYELGHFTHIAADAEPMVEGVILTYIFREKQFIDEIRIVGNDKIRTRAIRGVLSWQQGDSFVESGYPAEREAILGLYQEKGFPNAEVEMVVQPAREDRVRITYFIDEGRKARIRSISIDGNTVLTDRKIRKLMDTKQRRWLFRGKYDEDVFDADLELILNEYGNFGRLDAAIQDTRIAFTPNGKRMDINIGLAEGPEYHVDTLEFANNDVFDDDELLDLTEVRSGEVHNKGQVREDALSLAGEYQDAGYIAAEVEPLVTVNRESETTHVVHQVDEGYLKYVRDISITGNTVTRDEVVRRQLVLYPGERYDGTRAALSERRLINTQYYDTVRIFPADSAQGSNPLMDLLVDLEEGDTGNFIFGGGFSTDAGLGGFVELRLDNFDISNWPTFQGGGQQFTARGFFGDQRNEFLIGFTEPELLGYPISAGIDVFKDRRFYRGGINYTEEDLGTQLRFSKALSNFVNANWSIRAEEVDNSDFPDAVHPFILQDDGASNILSTRIGFTRNTLDRVFDPSTGARHNVSLQIAGLGGDHDFAKLEHQSTWYRPITENEKWIFSFKTGQGLAEEYGSSDHVPISQRFFAGGTSTARGYDVREVGPRRKRTDGSGSEDAVGGKARLVNSAEVKYKFPQLVRLYFFLDSAGVWEELDDFDPNDIRYGAGIGLGVEVPRLGPFRLDYGVPLNPDDHQGSGQLHFLSALRF
jgi:outer membrane protein insertion porin family